MKNWSFNPQIKFSTFSFFILQQYSAKRNCNSNPAVHPFDETNSEQMEIFQHLTDLMLCRIIAWIFQIDFTILMTRLPMTPVVILLGMVLFGFIFYAYSRQSTDCQTYRSALIINIRWITCDLPFNFNISYKICF